MAVTRQLLPPITAGSTFPCWPMRRAAAEAPTWAFDPRCQTWARPSPEISACTFRKAPAFYLKSYENAWCGGELEVVQDARGNHALLREVPSLGGPYRKPGDRHLPSCDGPAG